jgi:molecular chaperone HtpG
VDSADLPLNISREILQQNRTVEAIRKGAMGKVFGMLEDLAKNNADTYATFWNNFGSVLKEGVIEDYTNRERIQKLLRFSSTHTGSATPDVSLEAYVARMKPGQEKIYYVVGESFAAAANSPHLEIFRKKGIEVLILHERIDEWLASHLTDFDGKSLQAVSKGKLDLGKLEDGDDQTEEQKNEVAGDFKDLTSKIQQSLGEDIKEVRISDRLTDSPACLVSDEHDMSPTMEHILKSAGQEVPTVKRILEINPSHPLVMRLKNEAQEDQMNDWSRLLFDQALLSEGGQLTDPAAYVKRLNRMLLNLAG